MQTTIIKKDTNIIIETLITTAKDMYVYNNKTYTHTEYQTDVDTFLEDNCDWLFYHKYPVHFENDNVIATMVISNIHKEKLEKGFNIFSKYLSTFLKIVKVE